MSRSTAVKGGNADAKTVVFAEDDDDLLQVLTLYFRGLGYRTRGYKTAELLLKGLDWGPHIDCIISDVRLPGMDGLGLLTELRARGLDTPVVIVTGHGDIPLAVRAMRMGASDFVEKPMAPERLEAAVLTAIKQQRAATSQAEEVAAAQAKLGKLTARQSEVLDLIAQGMTSKEIAVELQMSNRTVEVHRASLMERLEVNSLADLLRIRLLADFRDN